MIKFVYRIRLIFNFALQLIYLLEFIFLVAIEKVKNMLNKSPFLKFKYFKNLLAKEK